jgi:hypothetical protein
MVFSFLRFPIGSLPRESVATFRAAFDRPRTFSED